MARLITVKCRKCGFIDNDEHLLLMLVTGDTYEEEKFVPFVENYDNKTHFTAMCCPVCKSDHDLEDIYYVIKSSEGYWNFEKEQWVKTLQDATVSIFRNTDIIKEVTLPVTNMWVEQVEA